ncbi:MAG TPA: nitroreductase/quinone reductase family protein [Acidimicrobiales bacterium]|nr:nitroreductase/quinone reductase family protein [Acidimicrobiales bacterium]
MALKEVVADAGLKAMNITHRIILRASQGRLLTAPFGMPAVELTVTGRKSGLPRKTLLTAPIIDQGKVVLVASKGGDDRDPEWFRNLVANPDVEVKVISTGEVRRLRARVADPEEKAAMWPAIVASYKGYAGYQRRTQRDIPVVICEPAVS